MASLSNDLHRLLLDNGAALIGFADLSAIIDGPMQAGVSVAVAIPAAIVRGIGNGPTRAYFDAYHALNNKLDGLVTKAAKFLEEKGYEAFAQTRDAVEEYDLYRTRLPHKTVATAAGLGWIGKSALFISPEYGPSIRLSSLITNAPLEFGTPIRTSRCGGCTACRDACPGKAISGELWQAGLDRDAFFNPSACRKAARALSKNLLNEEITLCGKCIEVCPYTRKYLESGEITPTQR